MADTAPMEGVQQAPQQHNQQPNQPPPLQPAYSTSASTSAPPADASTAASVPLPSSTSASSSSSSSASASASASSSSSLVLSPMLPPPPPSNVRIEGGRLMAKIDKPFVYGSAAFWQGKNTSDSQHSHRWTVYLRGLENEDLSYFIKSVAFTLHQSFAEPTRVLYSAPYEVSETGWGEFIIGITVTFHESSGLEPIQLQHMLKLFPPPNVAPSTKKPVMSEVYDEFVFVDPSQEWWDRLHSGPTRKIDNHPLMPWFTTPEFAKEEDSSIAKLQAANENVQAHIDQLRSRLFVVEQDVAQLTKQL